MELMPVFLSIAGIVGFILMIWLLMCIAKAVDTSRSKAVNREMFKNSQKPD
jgi:hypothetical protein